MFFFFSSRRRHTRCSRDWSSDVCSSDLVELTLPAICAIPNGLVLEWVRGGTLGELGLLAEPLRLERGVAHASEAPGHGVVLDRDALAPYEVDAESLRLLDTRAA